MRTWPASLLLLAAPAWAQAPSHLNDPCGRAADCPANLYCVANKCRVAADLPEPTKPESKELELRGTHWFVGTSLGAGMGVFTGWPSFACCDTVLAELSLFVQAGVLIDRVQLEVEATPISSTPFRFQGNVAAAYLAPISDRFSWPLRLGLGGGAMVWPDARSFGSPPTQGPVTAGFFEFRVDLFGFAVSAGPQLLLEFDIPSFRMFVIAQGPTLLGWTANFGLHYVF